MLRIFSVLLSLSVIIISCSGESQFQGKFGYSPDMVTPGEEITVFYNQDSSDLAGSDGIKCIAYLFNKKLIISILSLSTDNLVSFKISNAS